METDLDSIIEDESDTDNPLRTLITGRKTSHSEDSNRSNGSH